MARMRIENLKKSLKKEMNLSFRTRRIVEGIQPTKDPIKGVSDNKCSLKDFSKNSMLYSWFSMIIYRF